MEPPWQPARQLSPATRPPSASTGLRSASNCPPRVRAAELLVAVHGDLLDEHQSPAKRAAAMAEVPREQRAASTGRPRTSSGHGGSSMRAEGGEHQSPAKRATEKHASSRAPSME
ncbi:hypothetical protein Dimus_022449, partial [Dionaea muscipula]